LIGRRRTAASLAMSLSISARVAAYFEALSTRFRLEGVCSADEVFDPAGFLPVVAHIAEARMRALGLTLAPQFRPSDVALFGREVAIPWSPMATAALVQAAEDLVFDGQPVHRGAQVDLMPAFVYYSTPSKDRSALPWKPRKV